MKKKTIFTLIGALALVALLFWPEISKAGAAFTFDPASGGKVGEKIKINITEILLVKVYLPNLSYFI